MLLSGEFLPSPTFSTLPLSQHSPPLSPILQTSDLRCKVRIIPLQPQEVDGLNEAAKSRLATIRIGGCRSLLVQEVARDCLVGGPSSHLLSRYLADCPHGCAGPQELQVEAGQLIPVYRIPDQGQAASRRRTFCTFHSP